ncbi:calcium-binding protein [Rubellimicrobium arenae]|uniref:calcium-binding protein n=1 Tax=Rubellimicrobium arenae TaxID=2817372 RepID=UPI001B30BC76
MARAVGRIRKRPGSSGLSSHAPIPIRRIHQSKDILNMARFDGTNLADILNGTDLADLMFGNGGNDWIRGNGGNDTIRGGSGSDILEGNAGDDIIFADSTSSTGGEDVLFGGADSDILVSGTGKDHFNGGSGIDAASWQESNFAVAADIDTGRATNGGIEDTFTLIENLIGSRFGDTLKGDEGSNGLFGGDGADMLFGRAGNDHLSGGAGNDTLDGGSGFNTLKGGAGFDTADYTAAVGGVSVDLNSGQAITDDRVDSLTEVEGVRGTNLADRIVGNVFGNLLSGNGGNDTINGGQGNDILVGGTGADTFAFRAVTPKFGSEVDSGVDRISDFSRSQRDRIDLSDHEDAVDFATLRSQASQFGTDTHLLLGDDTIVIEDVALSQLSADMFVF